MSSEASGHKMPKIDPLLAVAAIAVICGIVYGLVQHYWGGLVFVVILFVLIFCFRALMRDMYDEKAKTEGSEAYDCGFEDPAELKLICPKDTFGTNPFYVYCENRCVAKIARGDELIIRVPRGRINLGLIRIKDMVPSKYLLIDTETDTSVYVFPDSNDNMLAYRLFSPKDSEPEESIFRNYYLKQKNGSVRISAGVLIVAIIIIVIVVYFFRPF